MNYKSVIVSPTNELKIQIIYDLNALFVENKASNIFVFKYFKSCVFPLIAGLIRWALIFLLYHR